MSKSIFLKNFEEVKAIKSRRKMLWSLFFDSGVPSDLLAIGRSIEDKLSQEFGKTYTKHYGSKKRGSNG